MSTTATVADGLKVREDPDLIPLEKETSINFTKGDERADVFTSERGLTRRLLTHELFDTDAVLLKDGSTVDSVDSLRTNEDTIVGVRGTIPIGALKVKATTRSDKSGHARVVSDVSSAAGGEDQ
jgi:hypothetical protein